MKKKILIYIGLMVFGLYMMPNTATLFAGQHTFYNSMGVSCDKCHSDVLTQLESSGYVYQKHRAAAGNANYTTYLSLGGKSYSNGKITAYDGKIWSWNGNAWQNGSSTRNVSLDRNNDGINGDEICMLCHNATLTGSIAHSGIVVRVCDDDRCHGNRNYAYDSPELLMSTSNITAAGYNLSQTNVHQPFYLESSNQSSRHVAGQEFGVPGNTNGSTGFISRGYWTCEGCHTETAITVTTLPLPAYNHSVSNPEKKRYS